MPTRAQGLANHARYVPLFHFVLGALVALNFFHASRLAFAGWTQDSLWGLVTASALVLMFWFTRAFPTGVQDRVIRLEMRLRCQGLLPAEQFRRFDELAIGQVVALRFAGDGELPGLYAEALGGLPPGEIKKRVKDWQADWQRI